MLFVALPLAAAAAGCSASPSATPPTSSSPPGSTAAPASSAASATVDAANVGSLGMVLVDSSGATLYALTADKDGQSHCTGTCATTWPPLAATGTPTTGSSVHGTLATIRRSDGSLQVTFDGMPLYRYSGDHGPGQANGQGVGGVWYVVPAAGSGAGASASTTTSGGASGYGSGY